MPIPYLIPTLHLFNPPIKELPSFLLKVRASLTLYLLYILFIPS